MVRGVIPECRYGHGTLVRQETPIRANEKIKSEGKFFAATVLSGSVDLGRGFIFEIWQCRTCSYLELHDSPSKDES